MPLFFKCLTFVKHCGWRLLSFGDDDDIYAESTSERL